MKTFRSKKYHVPTSLQAVFLATVGGTYLLASCFILAGVLSSSESTAAGGPYVFVYGYIVLPLAMFGAAYYVNPRRLQPLARSFESLVVSSSATALWVVAVNLLTMLAAVSGSYGALFVVAATVYFALYAGLLLRLRASKRWH